MLTLNIFTKRLTIKILKIWILRKYLLGIKEFIQGSSATLSISECEHYCNPIFKCNVLVKDQVQVVNLGEGDGGLRNTLHIFAI